MGRRKKKVWCPHRNRYCDGANPEGELLCAQCLDEASVKLFGIKTSATEYDMSQLGKRRRG